MQSAEHIIMVRNAARVVSESFVPKTPIRVTTTDESFVGVVTSLDPYGFTVQRTDGWIKKFSIDDEDLLSVNPA